MARCTNSITRHVRRECDLLMPQALASTAITAGPTRDLSTTPGTHNCISIVSGYLWAVRQTKKTDHYESTPKVFVDSWGLSGNRVQVFRTETECSPQWKTEKCSRRNVYD